MLIPSSRISTRLIAVPILVARRWFSIHAAALSSRPRTFARAFANAISDLRSQALRWAPAGIPAFAWAAAGDPPADRAVAHLGAALVAAAGTGSNWGRATGRRRGHTSADR